MMRNIITKTMLSSAMLMVSLMCSAENNTQRNPMLPLPPSLSSAPELNERSTDYIGIQPGSVAIVIRDGITYIALGARLYSVGQMLGTAKIKSISESEVVVVENGKKRTISVYAGIKRQASKAKASE